MATPFGCRVFEGNQNVTDEVFLIKDPALKRPGWYIYVTPSEVPLDQLRVARRAVRRGCEQLGIPEPRIRWFAPAYRDTEGAFFVGHEFGGRVFPDRLFEVELLADWSPDVERSCLHELRHVYQFRRWGLVRDEADRGRREADARWWANEMMRSEWHERTGGGCVTMNTPGQAKLSKTKRCRLARAVRSPMARRPPGRGFSRRLRRPRLW
jgi:hypothetical protein